MNEKHEANRQRWEATHEQYKRDHSEDWDRAHLDLKLGFEGESLGLLQEYMGDMRGKRCCVLASGDNKAAFALAGMGAEVTSVDISQRQLDTASARAKGPKWS